MFYAALIAAAFALLLLYVLYRKERIPSLVDKHLLVTGGSSGIGRSVAIKGVSSGAHVTIVARDVKKLEAVTKELNDLKTREGQKVGYIALDVSEDCDEVERKLSEVEENVGPIFMLVNCVGKAVCKTFDEASSSHHSEMLKVNYLSAVYPTQIVAKRMKARKEGHIVICGSQASLLGIFGMSAYCGSKFALRGYAESLYMELIPYNVSVTLCLPPDTNTPGYEIENLSKPLETKLISQSAGLFEANEVAHKLLADALSKRFFSTVGVESFLLTTLCAGMSPFGSVIELALQSLLMSIFRVIGVCYQFHFRRLILDCHAARLKAE